MGRNNDTDELNEILHDEGFKGDIPDETEDNTAQIEFCEINDYTEESSDEQRH